MTRALLVVTLLAMPCLRTGAQQPVEFQTGSTLPLAGLLPRKVLPLDVDRDGHLDLLVTSSGYLIGSTSGEFEGSQLSLLFGDGVGGFGPTQALDVGPAPWDLASADFDGDGIADLALTQGTQILVEPDALCGEEPGVPILLGDGRGGFLPVSCVHGSVFPVAVEAADFDRDGEQDLAIAYNVIGGLKTARGLGNGTFEPPRDVPWTTNTHMTDMLLADFDGDGVLDIAVSHLEGSDVHRGAPDGTFAYAGSVDVGHHVHSLAAGELTGDDRLDLVTIQRYTGLLSVFRGQGNGTFAASPIAVADVGTSGRAVQIADFDTDGLLDIVATGEDMQGPDVVTVLKNTGGGSFLPGTHPVGSEPVALAVGAFGPGVHPHIAVALRNDGLPPLLSVLLNQTPDPVPPLPGLQALRILWH